MTINKIRQNGEITFELAGRLDTTSAPQLQEALLPAFDGADSVTLEFSGLAYVSSAGLRVLLMGEKTAKSKGVPMRLAGVSEDVMEVFEMTGFADILTIV